eukprot:gnl/MRDRNA2_/MRDRNA2_74444_c0_seq1.p1 gnl/MRDRNA2_/MRDRNA2_74444_c0~~gnl/MRDRNA2_/MRDRNA2_74444_c0_seq1.p1  ORF type:complete len:951 (+),score=113.85 gnl/MRDRNA2_/MRDRNA2_74444_c0_seq1:99-2951(+)
MFKLHGLCICALLFIAPSKVIQRGCATQGAISMLAVGTEGLKHDILLQVNLEKSSQHEIISESQSGTFSAAVEFDGRLSAGENLSAPLSVLDEQRSGKISHASFDPNVTELDPESNSTLKVSPNSTEVSPFDSVTLSRKQVTDAYLGALIVLGGISILVGNFLLEKRSKDNTGSQHVDSWSASFSGKPQSEIAKEINALAETPRSRKAISEALADSLTPDYTNTSTILGEKVVRDDQLCDYVLVMPLKGTSRANLHVSGGHFMRLDWDYSVDGLAKAKEVFMSPNKANLFTEEELQERFSSGMTSEEYHDAIRKLLAETFTGRHFGLSIGADPSADHDEIFVKLSVPRHNGTIGSYAGNLSYQMPLNDATYERIGKGIKMDADENYIRAFTEFFPEHQDIYESFREIDYVRLLKARLDKYLNLTALCNQGVVAAHFSPHNYTEVRAMCETWANVWKWYRIPTHDNNDKIRNYFGEEVAWMFVWNVHYVRWLCLPATIGALMYFRIFLPVFLHNEIKIAFAVLMAIWSTLFNSFYDRSENRIQHRWGMHYYTPMASLFSRNDFRPQLKDSWTLIAISFLGDVLGLLTLGMTVGGMVVIDRLVDKTWYGHSFLITAQIILIDIWWRNVSLLIVQGENHEHQDKWLRSWTRKMFIVRIFNNLYPFLYVGFFKEHYTEKGCKPFDSCLDELSWDLLSYFAARILREVGANMLRLGVLRLQMIHEAWRGLNTPAEQFVHTYLELQAKTLPYNDVVKMNDWIEQVLTFVFVACFSVVLPAISFVALLVSLLRTRIVAHRNANYLRRPLPRGSRGIDAWRDMLFLTEVVAVVINLGFAIFVMKPLCDLPLDQKYVMFFVAEHLILAVKLTFKNKFPTIPSDVEKIERSCKSIVRRSFIDLRRHPVDCDVVQFVDDIPSIGPNAFGGRNSTLRRDSKSRRMSFHQSTQQIEEVEDDHT